MEHETKEIYISYQKIIYGFFNDFCGTEIFFIKMIRGMEKNFDVIVQKYFL